MKEDRVAFLLLFCGMILVKKDRATLAETVSILPLDSGALRLAGELSLPPSR
jgi:hypothetical protein